MPNMSLKKNEMPSQDPNVRNKNFLEVALGYTEEQALDEAARCLNCKNHPCVSGCPVQVKIPEFIKKITEKDYEGAYQVIHETSSLPAVCGRVCPQETQCESKCVRGIKGEPVGIGRLERFVADWHNANVQEAPAKPVSNGHKVAVIGSGPSGLTCAGDLAKKGYDVTVFEALHLAGGVLVYGIPEFRLPKAIVQKEVDGLKALGVKVETNMVIGRVVSIDELMSQYGFEAVFIGSGAGLPMFMHIPGENLCGVYSANEFLTRINLMKAYKDGSDTPIMPLAGKKSAERFGAVTELAEVYKVSLSGKIKTLETSEGVFQSRTVVIATGASPRPLGVPGDESLTGKGVHYCAVCDGAPYRGKTVAVVGGGNSAAADALALSRIAQKVYLIHRRDSLRATKVYHEPLMNAPNVEFCWNSTVSALLHDSRLTGLRLKDVNTGAEHDLACNGVFISVGRAPATELFQGELALDKSGYIIADESTRTSLPGVFAVGDVRTKALRQVVTAVSDGAVAVHYAEEYLAESR